MAFGKFLDRRRLFSWLVVPPIAAWLTVPHFMEIISQAPASTFGRNFFLGCTLGIGGIMYGLGMRYLGISLGNSVLFGFTSAFGALAHLYIIIFFPRGSRLASLIC